MATIATRTIDQVHATEGLMRNTLKTLEQFRSDSTNPALAAGVDTALTAVLTDLATVLGKTVS